MKHINPTVERLFQLIKPTLAIVGVPAKMGMATCITMGMIAWSVFAMRVILPLYDVLKLQLLPQNHKEEREVLRQFLAWPLRIGCRLILFCLGFFNIVERGACPPDARYNHAPFIVANHISIWEAMFLYWRYGGQFVTRVENLHVLGLKYVLALMGYVSVDRASNVSRKHTMDVLIQRGKEWTDSKTPPHTQQTIIFPEGTTTKGGSAELAPFKHGAFAAGVPVQPVAVHMPWRYFDPSWTVHQPRSIFTLLVGMYSQYYNSMEIEYLNVYYPTIVEQDNPQLYASSVRSAIQSVLIRMESSK